MARSQSRQGNAVLTSHIFPFVLFALRLRASAPRVPLPREISSPPRNKDRKDRTPDRNQLSSTSRRWRLRGKSPFRSVICAHRRNLRIILSARIVIVAQVVAICAAIIHEGRLSTDCADFRRLGRAQSFAARLGPANQNFTPS
jgi:hypothetical protein